MYMICFVALLQITFLTAKLNEVLGKVVFVFWVVFVLGFL